MAFFQNQVLEGHTVKEVTVRSLLHCGNACEEINKCWSFNVQKTGEGSVHCELIDQVTHNCSELTNRFDSDHFTTTKVRKK